MRWILRTAHSKDFAPFELMSSFEHCSASSGRVLFAMFSKIIFAVSILLTFLLVICLLLCFCIAWILKHISHSTVPYISDLGIEEPESFIFCQILNTAAMAGLLMMVLRYYSMRVRPANGHINRLCAATCTFGIVTVFSLTIVANFKECDSKVGYIHTTGSTIFFVAGTMHAILDAILTILLTKQQHFGAVCTPVPWYGWLRLILAAIAVGNIVVGITAKVLHDNKHCAYARAARSETQSSHPQSAPNVSYMTSAIVEWLLTAVFILYNATFIPEYYNHSTKTKAVNISSTQVDDSSQPSSSTTLL